MALTTSPTQKSHRPPVTLGSSMCTVAWSADTGSDVTSTSSYQCDVKSISRQQTSARSTCLINSSGKRKRVWYISICTCLSFSVCRESLFIVNKPFLHCFHYGKDHRHSNVIGCLRWQANYTSIATIAKAIMLK